MPDARVTVVRRSDSNQPEPSTSIDCVVPTLAAALDTGVDLGIVASPAPFHAAAAIALLDAGATVLVEKPLASTTTEALSIGAHRHADQRVLVGYHLRFGDTVPALARIVSDGTIGEPTHFALSVGQHLADWRPTADPRESVTARHELGGGVLLELSHEIDGARYLFGDALDDGLEVAATTRHDGAPTDGIVDTVADLSLTTANGLDGRIHLDMISATPHRVWTVTGRDATATADLMTGTITVSGRGGTAAGAAQDVTWRTDPGERDRAEHRLVTHLREVASGAAPRCTVGDGVAALQIVEAARDSARSSGTPTRISNR